MTYQDDDEEVKTYSQLVALLESSLASFMDKEVERFKSMLSLFQPPPSVKVTPSNKEWRVAAVDGGSSVLSFADVNVAFIAALAVIDDGREFRRTVSKPKLLTQEYGEPEGDFADRVDVERETMMLMLAQRVVREESPDLLVVDGPLIPRPKYVGEYVLQLKTLLSLDSETMVVGFVKRPQSRYLSNLPLTDRALLSTCLEKFSASPWPPATMTAFEGVSDTPVRYTYLRLLEEPESGVFRIDMHPSIDNLTAYEILSYLAYTSDPQKGPPSILMKADEEVKVSRRLVAELYRSCFTTIASKAEPRLWAPLVLRWGEKVW